MESECFTVSIQDPKGTETKVRIILEFEATSLLLAKDREVTFLLSSEEKVVWLWSGITYSIRTKGTTQNRRQLRVTAIMSKCADSLGK